MTKTEFYNAMQGRKVYVSVAFSASDHLISISQKQALELYDAECGDIAYYLADGPNGDMFVEGNAHYRYGRTGELETI